MENLSRTVRFKAHELEQIDEFLQRNPFFDFSSLTRIAVTEFIRRPTLRIQPIETTERPKRKPAGTKGLHNG